MPATPNTTTNAPVWLAAPKGQVRTIIAIRGIGWVSLLKLLSVGYLVGSLPFIILLNVAATMQPDALSEDVKRAISMPVVLLGWPILSLVAAWFTAFFVSVGLKIFGAYRPLRIAVFVDEEKKA